jgi:hypothetical protein
MASLQKFRFHRLVRTATSESYVIWGAQSEPGGKGRVGVLDLHFQGRTTHGTLVLEEGLLEEERDDLLSQIDDQLIESDREDFIYTVYHGREIGYYSDLLSDEDHARQGATQRDIEDIRSSLSQVLGRHQSARGKLAEHAITSYFESLKYKARRAGPELDAQKVDVVAESANEIIYAQSKLGAISSSDIRKVVLSVSMLPVTEGKRTVAALIARSFPSDCEFQRRALEEEFGISVMCIQLYQVTNAVPEYKHPIGG